MPGRFRFGVMPLLVSVLLLDSYATEKMDTTSLQNPGGAARRTIEIRRPSLKSEQPPLPEEQVEDIGALEASLKSLEYLLSVTPKGPESRKLAIGKIKATLFLALKKTDTAEKRELLEACVRDADRLVSDAGSDDLLKADANFLSGLALVRMERQQEGILRFKKSLEQSETSPYRDWMTFFIAESHFVNEEYPEAIKAYEKGLKSWSESYSKVALYKLAWSNANVKRIDQAISAFARLIKEYPTSELADVGMKDLAFLVARLKNEKEILAIGAHEFRTRKEQFAYLRAVQVQLEAQGLSTLDSEILKVIAQQEKDPVEKFKLRLGVFGSVGREYASVPHFETWNRLREELEAISPQLHASTSYAAAASVFDEETQRLIRAYMDTYSGKTKTPEKDLDRERVAASLRQALSFHFAAFPKSKARLAIAKLWLDLCAEEKDSRCSEEVSVRILADSELRSLHVAALTERIVAAEALYQKNPVEGKERLAAALEARIRRAPKDEDWDKAARRLAEIHLNAQEPEKAIPVLDSLFTRSSDADAFYRLQWARYLAKRDDEILRDHAARGKRFPEQEHPRLAAIAREATLRKAQGARTSGDVAEYQRMMRAFMASDATDEKKAIALKDYLNFLLQNKRYSTAHQELLSLPVSRRFSAEIQPFAKELAGVHISEGKFKEAETLLGGSDAVSHPELNSLRVIAALGASGRVDANELRSLPVDQRAYVLGILCTLKPEYALGLFKRLESLSDPEAALMLTALRLQKRKWIFRLSVEESAILANVAPPVMLNPGKTPLEQAIEGLRLPPATAGERELAQALQDALPQVRRIRGEIAAQLPQLPAQAQARVLAAASSAERRAGALIVKSPLPNGLTTSEAREYRSKLAEASKEFIDQARIYDNLAKKVRADIKRALASVQSERPPRLIVRKWPWPSFLRSQEARWKSLRSAIAKRQYIGAMLMTDFQKAKMQDTRDYYKLRVGILLQSSSSQIMRKLAYEELRNARQSELLALWK